MVTTRMHAALHGIHASLETTRARGTEQPQQPIRTVLRIVNDSVIVALSSECMQAKRSDNVHCILRVLGARSRGAHRGGQG